MTDTTVTLEGSYDPELAQVLFDTYRLALPNANIKVTWQQLPDEMKLAWRLVAEVAEDLAAPPT